MTSSSAASDLESTPQLEPRAEFRSELRRGVCVTESKASGPEIGRGGSGKLPKKKIERRTEWGADRQEKHLGRLIRRPTAWTTRGGCMSKNTLLYAQSASERRQEKPPSGGRLRARRT
jgi:hypothetical protein